MLPDINLLPKFERQRSLFVIIFLIAFLIWFIFTALLVFHYFHTKNTLERTQTEVEQLTELKTTLEQQVHSADAADASSLANAVEYAENVTYPTSALIDNLITLLPDYAYLSEYAYDEGSITIQSQFETMDVAAEYVARLVGSDYINDVKVDEIETFTIDEDEEDDTSYTTVPRYDVRHSLEANMNKLKGEADADE